jgi:hypothetical protein
MYAGYAKFDHRAQQRQRLDSRGAAGPCRRIDPKTGAVLGEIPRPIRITVPHGKLWLHAWRPKVIIGEPEESS